MRPLRALLPAATALLLSCGPLTETGNPITEGPSTETGNPTLTGILRDTSGLRAGGALVVLWSLPQGGGDSALLKAPARADSQRTKADGSYRFDSLGAGTYALEGADGSRGLFAWVPRAEIPAGEKKFLRRDTLVLKRPGRITGIARRDGNPLPAGVRTPGEGILVRVAGTGRAAYTDTAGRYLLDDVPEGSYPVAFAAADGHYLPKVLPPVALGSGDSVHLPEVVLEWSPFVAPPAIAGLAAAADSDAGVMSLSWHPALVANLHHYEVIRRDSLDPAHDSVLATADTALVDSVKRIPAGRFLRYAVVAVNALGARGPEGDLAPVPVPKPPDTASSTGTVTALVLDGGLPVRVLVRLHAIPAAPGPADSLPHRPVLVDTAWTGSDGQAIFTRLAAGTYTLECARPGARAAKAGIRPRADGSADTLRLAAPGSLKGTATRNHLWCSSNFKQDENIDISLSGLPGFTVTDASGNFAITEVPAGTWRLVVQPMPLGCFLPDTLAVSVEPGKSTALPQIPARPDSGFIPKVASLRIVSSGPGEVRLEWVPWSAYPELGGYEVYRRDDALNVLTASGLLQAAAWRDDLAGVPSGTRLNYVVRVVDKVGNKGPLGGDSKGMPVYFTVP